MRNDFEVEQDLHFQYREWQAERIGWVIIALLIGAALGGFFGHHPLARVTDHASDGRLSIQYDRYARYETNVEFLVTLEPDKDGSHIVRLWFDPLYLDSLKVVAVSPVPLRGEAREGGRAFVFQTDGSRFTATVSIQFESIGLVHGSVWADDGSPIMLSHMVWP
jgi:hypothetical protein